MYDCENSWAIEGRERDVGRKINRPGSGCEGRRVAVRSKERRESVKRDVKTNKNKEQKKYGAGDEILWKEEGARKRGATEGWELQ